MSDDVGELPSTTDRRNFIGQVAATAVALATTACASTPAASAPEPATAQGTPPAPGGGPPAAAPVQWNNQWFEKVRGYRHKAVFEQAALEFLGAPSMATRWIIGMRDAQIAKPGEFQAVLVLRHEAVPLGVSEAMWAKYGLGEALKFKAPGGTILTTNPFAGVRPANGRAPRPNDPMSPYPNIPWFTANGHITLACNLAFTTFVAETATRVKADRAALLAEFKENLLPGVILQPNGVYATLRAQEAGCVHIRAS